MNLNIVSTGIEMLGNTVLKLNIENSIVDLKIDDERAFGINILEPHIEDNNNGYCAQVRVDLEIEIKQGEEQSCHIEMSIEGAFNSTDNVSKDKFMELVAINGVAALIGVARGKLESISANVFNSGKISIPFVNVIDYYKEVATE